MDLYIRRESAVLHSFCSWVFSTPLGRLTLIKVFLLFYPAY